VQIAQLLHKQHDINLRSKTNKKEGIWSFQTLWYNCWIHSLHIYTHTNKESTLQNLFQKTASCFQSHHPWLNEWTWTSPEQCVTIWVGPRLLGVKVTIRTKRWCIIMSHTGGSTRRQFGHGLGDLWDTDELCYQPMDRVDLGPSEESRSTAELWRLSMQDSSYPLEHRDRYFHSSWCCSDRSESETHTSEAWKDNHWGT